MAGNGWQGKGDVMEERTERWLIANGIHYRRDDQTARAANVIAVQGVDSLQFLEHLVNWRLLRPLAARHSQTALANGIQAAQKNPIDPVAQQDRAADS
jgi:hypothetical protein